MKNSTKNISPRVFDGDFEAFFIGIGDSPGFDEDYWVIIVVPPNPLTKLVPHSSTCWVDGAYVYIYIYILVGGLEHEFYFAIYWDYSSQLTFIFFRGVETTNQYIYIYRTNSLGLSTNITTGGHYFWWFLRGEKTTPDHEDLTNEETW